MRRARSKDGLQPVRLNIPMPPVKPPRQEVPEWIADEIKATWNAAREAGGQMEAFRIFERMTDRLGYRRLKDNPSLAKMRGNAGPY